MNKWIKWFIISITIICILVLLAGIYKFNFTNDDIYVETGTWEVIKYNDIDDTDTNKVCNSYSVDVCPSECVVCPPCPECSSLKCSSEEFCKKNWFDKSWYEW